LQTKNPELSTLSFIKILLDIKCAMTDLQRLNVMLSVSSTGWLWLSGWLLTASEGSFVAIVQREYVRVGEESNNIVKHLRNPRMTRVLSHPHHPPRPMLHR